MPSPIVPREKRNAKYKNNQNETNAQMRNEIMLSLSLSIYTMFWHRQRCRLSFIYAMPNILFSYSPRCYIGAQHIRSFMCPDM